MAGLSGDLSEEKLKEAFAKFDTSGDGYLDAEELRMAIKVLRRKLSLMPCQQPRLHDLCDGLLAGG